MRPFAFLCATALLLPSFRAQEPEAGSQLVARRPPNVVLLLADDLGFGELGCQGQRHMKTPHLDALATTGMRFSQAYCGAPVCAPSRCVLLTGKSPGHATIRDNAEQQPEGQAPIGDAETTLAEMLRQRGYATACIGKWGLGYPGSEGDPRRQGFDRFYGYNCQRHAHTHFPSWLWDDDHKVEIAANQGGVEGAHSSDLITEQAVAFVRAHRDEPFFLYVPFALPHLALQTTAEHLAAYRSAFDETPYEGKSYRPHPQPRACYAAMVSHLDACVGRIVAAIDELGLAEDTLILFSSDNGPTHLPAQVDVEFFASTGGLRGLKGSVYEGGIRVPMLARWKGRIQKGTVRDRVVAFQDVMPTLCELAGGAVPAAADGVSFAPTLVGNDAAQAE
ncbi:MAG: arylsulfatase, partial [Planctomycetota bacterium]